MYCPRVISKEMMLENTSEQSDHHFFKGLLTRKEVVASLDKSVL